MSNFFLYEKEINFYVGIHGFHTWASAERYASKRGLKIQKVCGWRQKVAAAAVVICLAISI